MSTKWAEHQVALIQEMKEWISDSIRRQEARAWSGITDEATFTSTWDGYYLLTGDERVLDFKLRLRDHFLAYAERHLFHGYYRTGEPHHQTETFNDFIGPFALLTSRGRETHIAILEDVAHHLGNWVDEVPPWFDWEGRRFLSWHMGTEKVDRSPEYRFETLDHFRFIQIALFAYRLGGASRYLEFAQAYCDRWLEIIRRRGYVPGVVFADAQAERIYREQQEGVKEVWFRYDALRADGGGFLDVLLDLYRLTGARRYQAGAQTVLDLFERINQIHQRYSETEPRLFAKYRAFTGDTRYDKWILQWLDTFPKPEMSLRCRLVLDGPRMAFEYRTPDGEIYGHPMPPVGLLVLAYQVTRDPGYLNRAFAMARDHLHAAQLLRDGREHGCDSRSISGIARSSVAPLYAATLGATLRFRGGIDTFRVGYLKDDGTIGLPDGLAAVFEPTSPYERIVRLSNTSDDPRRVLIRSQNGLIASVEATGGGIYTIDKDHRHCMLQMPGYGNMRVHIALRTPSPA